MTRDPRRGFTYPELLLLLLVLLGAIGGAVWGWCEVGFWGAVLGVPLGAVAGVVMSVALIVVAITVAWVVLTTCVLFKRGTREAWRFFLHGPMLAVRKKPRPTNTEPNV